ncbi:MAG: SMP-30/gluconolactonase/LRE family protein [Cyclobacteriaceae bacterium]|nr:SMP-30/gluconolactonase/LRE family protein [Cyclobacteriaceae bacterium]
MKIVKISLGVLMVVILYAIFAILVPAGVFKTITPHFDGTVTKIQLPIAGPEDITIDLQSGLAFISVDDRRSNMAKSNSVNGGILLMNLSDSMSTLRNVTPADLNDFHPHGISLWKEPDGRMFLFVITHGANRDKQSVERFIWRNDSLIYLETILHPTLMTSPNDLTAVGERSFYVTNDHGYSNAGLGRTLEDYLQRSISYVNYYDGTGFRKVATDIAYANGINHSADLSKVYIASCTGRKVLIYDRDLVTGDLTLNERIRVNTGVDNIELDADGSLWIGAHPQLLKFASHAKDPTKHSPSQVIKLFKDEAGKYQLEEIYLNNGIEYSGSSVGAVYKNKILIGSVFEKSFLTCELKQ